MIFLIMFILNSSWITLYLCHFKKYKNFNELKTKMEEEAAHIPDIRS